MISNCYKCAGPGKLRVGFLGECKGVWCPQCGEMTDSTAEWEILASAARIGVVAPDDDDDKTDPATWIKPGVPAVGHFAVAGSVPPVFSFPSPPVAAPSAPLPPAPPVSVEDGSVVALRTSPSTIGVVRKNMWVCHVDGRYDNVGKGWAYLSLSALARHWQLLWVFDGGRYRCVAPGGRILEAVADVVPGHGRAADIKFINRATGGILGHHTSHDRALRLWEALP